jgi:hypothetical protein
MLGQTFCGQSGHGLAGLWHGIWSAVTAVVGPAMATTIDVVIGKVMSDPSMETMPRTKDQRCDRRFVMLEDWHT